MKEEIKNSDGVVFKRGMKVIAPKHFSNTIFTIMDLMKDASMFPSHVGIITSTVKCHSCGTKINPVFSKAFTDSSIFIPIPEEDARPASFTKSKRRKK